MQKGAIWVQSKGNNPTKNINFSSKWKDHFMRFPLWWLHKIKTRSACCGFVDSCSPLSSFSIHPSRLYCVDTFYCP